MLKGVLQFFLGPYSKKKKIELYKQEKVRLSAFWRKEEQMAILQGGQEGKGADVGTGEGGGDGGEGEGEGVGGEAEAAGKSGATGSLQ